MKPPLRRLLKDVKGGAGPGSNLAEHFTRDLLRDYLFPKQFVSISKQ